MKNHLPRYGVGPFYVIAISILSLCGIVLHVCNLLESGAITNIIDDSLWSCVIFYIIGVLLIVVGILLWIFSLLISKIVEGIYENRLITTGIYAWVRNPIYSGAIFICSGAVLFCCNLWLLICPIIDYITLTVLMIFTEEKWLRNLYGQQYIDYCKKVNRILPWFPKK